jgi:hypothetical protein
MASWFFSLIFMVIFLYFYFVKPIFIIKKWINLANTLDPELYKLYNFLNEDYRSDSKYCLYYKLISNFKKIIISFLLVAFLNSCLEQLIPIIIVLIIFFIFACIICPYKTRLENFLYILS